MAAWTRVFRAGKKWTDSRFGSPHDLLLHWIWSMEGREESRIHFIFFWLENWVGPFIRTGNSRRK